MNPEWEDSWRVEDFANAYRNWMEDTMDARGYGILLDVLHDTEFFWDSHIPRDADRADDGRYLRERFSEETGTEMPDEWMDWPCSFLEFLVALAYEIDDKIMYDADHPEQVREWFWTMLSNIGLDVYDNDRMLAMGSAAYKEISTVLEDVMARKYGYNGYPGIFPLSKPAMDQRNVEIWYQANAYFIERYFE